MEDLNRRGKTWIGLKCLRLCEISGSHSCVAKDSGVLGCHYRWVGGSQRFEGATFYLSVVHYQLRDTRPHPRSPEPLVWLDSIGRIL
jgi:hypothetical protein